MVNGTDLAFKEIANGAWFIGALTMAIGLFVLAIRLRLRHGRWRHAPEVCGAVGLGCWFVTSAVRAALNWGTVTAQAKGWDPEPWAATWPWYGMATIIGVLSIAWCVYVFSPYRWRNTLTSALIVASFLIPTLVWAYLEGYFEWTSS